MTIASHALFSTAEPRRHASQQRRVSASRSVDHSSADDERPFCFMALRPARDRACAFGRHSSSPRNLATVAKENRSVFLSHLGPPTWPSGKRARREAGPFHCICGRVANSRPGRHCPPRRARRARRDLRPRAPRGRRRREASRVQDGSMASMRQ